MVVMEASNPYADNVQAKANAPITVVRLLERAQEMLGLDELECCLETVYDRLDKNAPRIAIIGGSLDHPAHITDWETVLKVAACVWMRGGVPFYFSVPVVCDAIAQSTLGMSYSLQSRNAVAAMVTNQMEAHSYHAAYVITGCDKTPLAILAGLAHLDLIRRRRGERPLMATFHPAHVLRGGTLPQDLHHALTNLARRAEEQGYTDIANDLRDTMKYVLQCTSNAAYRAVLQRARDAGLITVAEHNDYEKRLAVHTCHHNGGICAFNGTGNSSRIALAAMGLVHPAVELLTAPPEMERVKQVVDGLFACLTRPMFSVAHVMTANFANAVRVYSATGGSTNLMMHLVAAMVYAGYRVTIDTIDYIRRHPPVPDIFDYSLTQGRDIFTLAQQCAAGQIRGTETLFYELQRHGVPMDLDTPTVTGTTWRERLQDEHALPANGVKENPVILSYPKRTISGVEVLRGNFFDSAVLKISGMTDEQLEHFNDKVAVVIFFGNEEEANARLSDIHMLNKLKNIQDISKGTLVNIASYNMKGTDSLPPSVSKWTKEELFQWMIDAGILRLAVVISGQGPEAFGMPEMFTPMQYVNARKALRRITLLLTDGRFSGVTYGPAIGHVTPEAINGGGIGLLQTGDLVHVQLNARRIDLLDPQAFAEGRLVPWDIYKDQARQTLGAERRRRWLRRQTLIAIPNRLQQVTDAAHGVVPLPIWENATLSYPLG